MKELPTKKQIPYFASENEEGEFWEVHDSADFIDWSNADRIEKEIRLH